MRIKSLLLGCLAAIGLAATHTLATHTHSDVQGDSRLRRNDCPPSLKLMAGLDVNSFGETPKVPLIGMAMKIFGGGAKLKHALQGGTDHGLAFGSA